MINLFSVGELKNQKVQNYKSLYDRPKSFLRALLQEYFLKILLILFPKNFLNYKTKIRFIMNKVPFHTYLFLVSLYLRLKNPRYFILPSTQIYALNRTIEFMKILKDQKIDCFLTGGCLLGAVRPQQFDIFKGRDIDLGIKENQLPKLLETIPLLIESGAKFIRQRPNQEKTERLQISYRCILIDVGIYRKKNVNGKELWISNTETYETSPADKKFGGFFFPLDYLIAVKVYGREFLSPSNPEVYLEKKYGKDWKIPDKKQFFFHKNKFK